MTENEILKQYELLENKLASLIGKVKFSAAINLRLERITQLLELLDNPQLAFPSIHVGGTSGKGSTATIISSILTSAGYRTGLHVSPHLQIFNERHQINNQVAKTSRLLKIYSEIIPAIEKVAAENKYGQPSYFEAQFALTLCYFRAEKIDIGVIEVGLGGTLDATNVIPAEVAVLTSVGLDHTAILGESIELISKDKAGIIKPGQTVVCGFVQPCARQIVADRCQAQGAVLWQIGQEFSFSINETLTEFAVQTPGRYFDKLQTEMPGEFQAANAACAVAAVQALKNFHLPEQALRQGLRQARLPGRMEVVQQKPTVVLDGAHNPDKMKSAATVIARQFSNKRQIVVLGLKSDKAMADILPFVLQQTDLVILTAFYLKGLWEPADPAEIAAIVSRLKPELSIQIVKDPLEAIQTALAQADDDDLIWVTGSLYLLGDIREYWYPAKELIIRSETGLSGALVLQR